jgi:hypothetical protein
VNPRTFAAALLAGFFVLAPSVSAQQGSTAHPGYRKLTFIQLKEFSKQGLDSLIVLEPSKNAVRIVATYDNPCNVTPAGRYRLSSDTLFILLRTKPALSEGRACPGVYIPEAFAADIKPLPPRRYTVRVAFKGRLWPQQPVWREVEVK